MKEKTNSKAGGVEIRNVRMGKGLKVKSKIKAGGLRMNHNERLMGVQWTIATSETRG